jgi:hypothetical protein
MAGYTRQSVADIIANAVIKAAPVNAEFNALRDAFAANTGHKHDNNTGEGAYIPLIADLDGNNKVVVDTANNRISVFVEVSGAPVEQLRIQDGVIVPVTDNDIDLGTSTLEFKNLFIDGIAKIDTLTVDENATVAGTLGVTGLSTLPTVNVDGGTIDGTVIGAATAQAITGTNITATTGFSGTLTGNVTGNLTGNSAGTHTGPVVGDVTGNVTASSGTSTFTDVTINGTLNMNAGTTGTITGLSAPVNTTDATTKTYVDTADALKLNLSGGTMSGAIAMGTNKITGLGTPTTATDAATKGYVDTSVSALIDSAPGTLDTLNELAAALGDDPNFATTVATSIATKVSKAGDTMTGNLVMGANKVTSTTTPTANDDLTRKGYVDTQDALKLSLTGGTMSGAIAMGTSKITGLGDPTLIQDAATKNYVDTQDALKLSLSGGTMTGGIVMGANKVTSTATPTANDDLTRKGYVDSILGSATSAADSAAAAAVSETNAAISEDNAAISEANAAASFDSFDDRYLGAKSSAPTLDNDGNALLTGALFFNTSLNQMFVWNGSAWQSTEYVSNNVDINGGTIDGTVIGGSTPAAISGTTGQFGTSLNVDGTVTADGLTVSSGATFDGGDTTIDFSLGTGRFTTLSSLVFTVDDDSNSADQAVYFRSNAGQEVATFKENGDISFYEDTGTTPKFFWDASAETLRLGDYNGGGTPSGSLFVDSNANNHAIHIEETAGGSESWQIGVDTDGDLGFYNSTSTTASVTFDDSGNVGIGTSTPTAPLEVSGSAYIRTANTAASQVLRFDRDQATTGDIGQIQFYTKDGAANPTEYGRITGAATTINNGIEKGDLYFSTTLNGTLAERARIDASGNVGIGTSSPAFSEGSGLEIERVSASATLRLQRTTTSASALEIQARSSEVRFQEITASAPMTYYTGGTESMRIDTSGNLGLGVTPSAWTNSFGVIQGLGGWSISHNGANSNSVDFLSNAYRSGGASTYLYVGSANATRYQQFAGAHQWFNAPSGTAGNPITFSQAMTLDASGNLLVGTTSAPNGTSVYGSGFVGETNSRMVLRLATSSTAQLSVARFYNPNGQVGEIKTDGTSTLYVTSSDYRLKEDVQPMVGASDRVLALNPVNFAWKAGGTRVDGFLAHEAQAIVPAAVTGEKDGEEMQAIDHSKLVPLLTAALQEALTEIADLKARVAALEA